MKLNATKSRDGSLVCAKSLLFGASDFEHVLAAVEHLGGGAVSALRFAIQRFGRIADGRSRRTVSKQTSCCSAA